MKDCIFCQISKGEAKSWKVYEDENVCAFFDYNPVNAYHTLVVSKRHYTNFLTIPPDILQKLILATQKIALIYKDKLGIENLQIINSCGSD
jgi:histidine triad (HIT) family protein